MTPDTHRACGPPPLLWAALFVAGAAQSLLRLYVDLALADGYAVPAARTWLGRDFTNLWVGAKLALAGTNIYDFGDYLAGLAGFGITQAQNYSYPPATLLVGVPLSVLPYPLALATWFVGGWVLFVLAARPFVRFHPAWLLLLPAVALGRNGQWGVIAGALFLWSFRGSGVAAGLLTLKPHLGLVLAATMLAKRRWQQIVIAAVTCAAVWGLAELAFGLTAEFLTDGVAVQRVILTTTSDQPYFGGMPSTYVHLRHSAFAWPAQASAALLAMALLWRVRSWPLPTLAFPAATATFIVLPYAFGYDMAVVSLGFAVLIHQRWHQLPDWQKLVAIVAFLAPTITWLAVTPLALLAGLWLQTTGAPLHADGRAHADDCGAEPDPLDKHRAIAPC